MRLWSIYPHASAAELVAMNENFVKARGVFEEMMEDSLARHTGGKFSSSATVLPSDGVSCYSKSTTTPSQHSEKLVPSPVPT